MGLWSGRLGCMTIEEGRTQNEDPARPESDSPFLGGRGFFDLRFSFFDPV
jgi:hypothetical protein